MAFAKAEGMGFRRPSVDKQNSTLVLQQAKSRPTDRAPAQRGLRDRGSTGLEESYAQRVGRPSVGLRGPLG